MSTNDADSMKGLEIAKAFFFEWGLPFIEREFPGLKERIAVGCFGGSQALGADDLLSQDHAWGPAFHIYLEGDYEIDDREIVSRMCQAAPKVFMGAKRGPYDAPVRLLRTRQFFEFIFSGILPKSDVDWVSRRPERRESNLYFLKHGSLFFDESGEFTRFRAQYARYPSDLLAMRMASCCQQISHYGEYNFCNRLSKRADPIPIQIALGAFSEAVMRMYFYLEEDFAPYWKWLAFEFHRRDLSESTYWDLAKLPKLNPSQQAEVVSRMCDRLAVRMCNLGIVSPDIQKSDRVESPLFFRYKKHIRDQISDSEIRQLV